MEYEQVEYKALIDINGKTMLTRILEAIYGSDTASYVLIVGIPKDLVRLPEGMDPDRIGYFEISGSHSDKVIKSAVHLLEKGNEDSTIFPLRTTHGVYLTVDVPALTPDILKRYVQQCIDLDASLYYCIVKENVMNKRFPGNGRSWINIDKENYCGGDVILGNLAVVEPSTPLVRKISENRKSFIKSVFVASPITFFKMIFKRIKMKDVEQVASKIFGFKIKIIISEDAELAFDIDKPFQLDLMRKYYTPPKLISKS